jgi:excisionase family DNA binding protein
MTLLMGDCRLVPCEHQHLHPITGLPPDYHYRLPDGTYEPRWKNKKKRIDPLAMWLSPKEAAVVIGVTKETVREWIKKGKLKSVSVSTRRKIHASWIAEVMQVPWLYGPRWRNSDPVSPEETKKSAPG